MGKGDIPRGRIGLVHALGKKMPVIFRQSNRFRAELLASNLKNFMEKGEFLLKYRYVKFPRLRMDTKADFQAMIGRRFLYTPSNLHTSYQQ